VSFLIGGLPTINRSEFLAHPKNFMNNSGFEHFLKMFQIARELTIRLGLGDAAFYASLLHYIGKLNLYYPLFFLTGKEALDYVYNPKIGWING
jgi:hypothetical protein